MISDSDSSDDDILVPNGFVDVGEDSVELNFHAQDKGCSPPPKKKKRKQKGGAEETESTDPPLDLTADSPSIDECGDNSNSILELNEDDDSSDLIEIPEDSISTRGRRASARAAKQRKQPKRDGKKTPNKLPSESILASGDSSVIDLNESETFVNSPEPSPQSIFDVSGTPQSSFCYDLDDEPASTQPTAEDPNCETTIRVLWKGCETRKFIIRKFQKITEIYTHYAQLEGVEEERILFTLHDKPVSPNDTPLSLNAGIKSLEGGVIDVEDVSSRAQNAAAEPEEDPSALKLSVQRKGVREKHTVFIRPHEQISVLVSKLSEDLKIPYASIKLMFDGDVLDVNQTATDCDLEGDECIDLIVK